MKNQNLQIPSNLFPPPLKSSNPPLAPLVTIHKYLYNRYSSSQNYYYTKTVNNILTNTNNPKVIKYNDHLDFAENRSNFLKIYQNPEITQKILYLTEYYKFHNDLPRNFMMPVSSVLHHYYDKKRKINFIKIKKLLDEDCESDLRYSLSDSSFRKGRESVEGSLLCLLPEKLKRELQRKKKSKEEKANFDLSSTIFELNDFLGSVFESKDFGKKKDRFKIENNSFFDCEESISKNFFKKKFKKIGNNIVFGKKVKLDFFKNQKFLQNSKIKLIMKNKLKKNTFLKKFAETKIRSNAFKKKKQNFMISLPVNETKMLKNSQNLKKYQNFNINNLNININFDQKKKSKSEEKKNFLKFKEKNIVKKNKEKSCMKNKEKNFYLKNKDKKKKNLSLKIKDKKLILKSKDKNLSMKNKKEKIFFLKNKEKHFLMKKLDVEEKILKLDTPTCSLFTEFKNKLKNFEKKKQKIHLGVMKKNKKKLIKKWNLTKNKKSFSIKKKEIKEKKKSIKKKKKSKSLKRPELEKFQKSNNQKTSEKNKLKLTIKKKKTKSLKNKLLIKPKYQEIFFGTEEILTKKKNSFKTIKSRRKNLSCFKQQIKKNLLKKNFLKNEKKKKLISPIYNLFNNFDIKSYKNKFSTLMPSIKKSPDLKKYKSNKYMKNPKKTNSVPYNKLIKNWRKSQKKNLKRKKIEINLDFFSKKFQGNQKHKKLKSEIPRCYRK